MPNFLALLLGAGGRRVARRETPPIDSADKVPSMALQV
jgi:hypothetical protein